MSGEPNQLAPIAPMLASLTNSENGSKNGDDAVKMEPSSTASSSLSADDLNGKSKKKRKVAIACVYCRRSHMICDDSRPCKRCVKRNIGHLCHDEPVSVRQKKRFAAKNAVSSESSTPGADIPTPVAAQNLNNLGNRSGNGFVEHSLLLLPSQPPPQQQQQQHSSLLLNQQPVFFSEHAGSEFSSLNEFLQMIDDPEFLNTMNNDPILQNIDNAMSTNASAQNLSLFDSQQLQLQPQQQLQQLLTPGMTSTSKFQSSGGLSLLQSSTSLSNYVSMSPLVSQVPSQLPNPPITDNARDKFFLTAADPTTEISPEERLKQVINAKLEAGLLKPYNYAEGYARLQRYMDSHMNPSSRQRILKPLSVFRPAFRAIAKTLKDIDLILVEESFERMLLDYDRVFTSMAIPACLWRRTGEIYRGNKEFASLVEVSIDDLKNGKLTVYELMSEESSVNFWEKYGSIAFDKTQKLVLTSCKLKTKDGRKKKNCCFSFTIRRDRYNIPSCIVGNFIPISG